MYTRTRLFTLICLLPLVLSACAAPGAPDASDESDAPQVRLTVFAAASLERSFAALAENFQEENPGVEVVFNLAGSQTLVDQLINGANADILATANTSTMDKANEAGLVGEAKIFTSNTLTLITPEGNPAGITGLDSSLDGKNLVICAPEVPCGSATIKLAGELGITLTPVSEEQQVSDVTNKVLAGEADAGIVYRTDAKGAGDALETIEISGAEKVVNEYPIAQVNGCAHPEQAKAFIDYVLSDQGQQILADHGFTRL